MFRKDLITRLRHHPTSLHELSEMLEEPVKDVEADLQHLLRSLRHEPWRAVITPARCNSCGFVSTRRSYTSQGNVHAARARGSVNRAS